MSSLEKVPVALYFKGASLNKARPRAQSNLLRYKQGVFAVIFLIKAFMVSYGSRCGPQVVHAHCALILCMHVMSSCCTLMLCMQLFE